MTLQGYDVSNWQNGINIGKLTADFIIVKATEGASYTSPSYKTQIKAAHDAGKLTGVYHFMRSGDITKQAALFMKTVADEIGRSVLILDVEDSVILGSEVESMVQYIYEQVHVYPWVYINASMLNKGIWTPGYVKQHCGIWLAGYPSASATSQRRTDKPPYTVPSGVTVCAWQYASTFKDTAYNGNLDVSVFYGDAAAWGKYANPSNLAHKAAAPIAAARKSNETIAAEVIAGKWGNGSDRVKRLKAAGYNPDTIQAIVNKRLK